MTVEQEVRNQEFNVSIRPRTAGKLKAVVYPEKVRGHAREILENTEQGKHRFNYVAEFTRYLHEEIDFEYNDTFWRPDFFLDNIRKGTCVDYCTTLTALLQVRSFTTRYALVYTEGDENSHLMVQVRFQDVDPEELVDCANEFYDQRIHRLAWESGGESNEIWLLCDPTTSPIAGVNKSQYHRVKRDGEVRWNHRTVKDYILFD